MSTETGAVPQPTSKGAQEKGKRTPYTRKAGAAVCDWIAGGGTLKTFCADETNPSRALIGKWLMDWENFRADYADACELAADAMIEDILQIADETGKGTSAADKKVRITARQWMAERLAPWKYGVKAGADDDEDEEDVILSPDTLSDEEWAERFVPK